MKIAYIGHTHFTKKLSKVFNNKGYIADYFDYNQWGHNIFSSIKCINEYDVIHFISGTGLRKFLYAFVMRYIFNKIIIVHFVGSDILRLHSRKFIDKINWIGAIKIAHRVLCVSTWLTKEIKPYCHAETFPLFFNNLSNNKTKYPEKFTILSYLPSTRPNFYGKKIVEELIINNPHIQFIILGCLDLNKYNNVDAFEIDHDINMFKFYNNISLLLRLTEHDGLSNMVLETLALDKHVVWTYSLPYVTQVSRNIKDVQRAIDMLKKEKNNLGASKWITENFDQDLFINSLENLYNNPLLPISKITY